MSPNDKKIKRNHNFPPGVKRLAKGEVVQVMPGTKNVGRMLDEFQGRVVEMEDEGCVVHRFTEGHGSKWYPFGEAHSLKNSVLGHTPVMIANSAQPASAT
jgi:hypothetical protein